MERRSLDEVAEAVSEAIGAYRSQHRSQAVDEATWAAYWDGFNAARAAVIESCGWTVSDYQAAMSERLEAERFKLHGPRV